MNKVSFSKVARKWNRLRHQKHLIKHLLPLIHRTIDRIVPVTTGWICPMEDRTEDDETNAICWIGAIKFSVQQNEGTERKGRRVKQRMAVQWTAGQWERRSTYLTWLPLALNAKQWSGMQGIMEQNSLRQILIHTSHYPRWIFTVFFNIVIIGLFQKSNQ